MAEFDDRLAQAEKVRAWRLGETEGPIDRQMNALHAIMEAAARRRPRERRV